jgi:hypothetical protein
MLLIAGNKRVQNGWGGSWRCEKMQNFMREILHISVNLCCKTTQSKKKINCQFYAQATLLLMLQRNFFEWEHDSCNQKETCKVVVALTKQMSSAQVSLSLSA